MSAGEIIRSIIRVWAVLLGLCWLYCAGFNAAVVWRSAVMKKHAPSHIPILGGGCAFMGLILWSVSADTHSHRGPRPELLSWGLLLLSLLLDIGSGPGLIVWGLPALFEWFKWRRQPGNRSG
jgi:hypothetical protein